MRLDRFLADAGLGSRRDVRELIRKGLVTVNGETCRDIGLDCSGAAVACDGRPVNREEHLHLMMNKPAGVVTAARDMRSGTVMDLLEPLYVKRRCMPVGRLDKDTTGLLIFTTDGVLGHQLLRPLKHVDKVYEADLERSVTAEDIRAFREGVPLEDFTCMPAELTCLEGCRARCVLREGKYHQVKRMFEAVGNRVLALKRVAFGGILLDEALPPGGVRPLSAEETALLYRAAEGVDE